MCTVGGAKLNEFCIATVTSASWAKASSMGASKQTTASAAPKTRKHNQWEPDMVEHSTAFRLPNVKATTPLQSALVAVSPKGSPRGVPGRGALILAAGASQRMGSPKALLPWGEGTLLEYVLQQARAAAVEDIVVVLGPATRHL